MIVSTYRKLWLPEPLKFPTHTCTRVMMMPIILGKMFGVPPLYWPLVQIMYSCVENRFLGEVGYLTIDEQLVRKGESLRRPGLHVDGYYHGKCGAWGGGGGWGSVGNGMLVASSTPHCRAYLGVVHGEPGPEGEANHLLSQQQCGQMQVFDENQIYWVDGACIHESMPVSKDTERQFIRLSMPNNGPWFEGYTENPAGIKPTGPILPAREKFMSKN